MVYYIMYNGQVTGPMSREQMAAYSVTKDTMVSADGGDWRPLYTYPELMEIASSASPANTGYQRQVGFGEAIKLGFNRYATFTGRSSRSEFWWWQLFTYLIMLVVSYATSAVFSDEMLAYTQASMTGDMDLLIQSLPTGYLGVVGVFQLLLFLPNLAVTVRRLHDTGRSGWWVLLGLICCIGTIILLVWYCQPSQERGNEYGSVPNCE